MHDDDLPDEQDKRSKEIRAGMSEAIDIIADATKELAEKSGADPDYCVDVALAIYFEQLTKIDAKEGKGWQEDEDGDK